MKYFIAERLSSILQERSLSRLKLAKMLRWRTYRVHVILNPKKAITISVLYHVAEVLHMDASELAGCKLPDTSAIRGGKPCGISKVLQIIGADYLESDRCNTQTFIRVRFPYRSNGRWVQG